MSKICKEEASNVAVFMPHPVKIFCGYKIIWCEPWMDFFSGVLILLYSANPAYFLGHYSITSLYLGSVMYECAVYTKYEERGDL